MNADDDLRNLLQNLQRRIEAIERHLGIEAMQEEEPAAPPEPASAATAEEREEELEFELGQSWFAKAGIVVLALGMAFLLTLPLEELPPIAVPLFGYALAGVLIFLSRLWRESLTLLSNYIRGAGLALLFFATLRLYYFAPDPVLSPDALASLTPLFIASVLSFVFAARVGSRYLTSLSAVFAFVTLIVANAPWATTAGTIILASYLSRAYIRSDWTGVIYSGIAITSAALFNQTVGNPLLTGSFTTGDGAEWLLAGAFATAGIYGTAFMHRKDRDEEDYGLIAAAILTGGGTYGVIVAASLAFEAAGFVAIHVAGSLLYLAIATAFWQREKSVYSTFLYAMLGYQALTIALLKAFAVPDVFVWLSVQSLVVVGTAVWFRSRFIVVMNFMIYLVILLGYMIVAEQESGISFAFGIVALASARILNWRQEALQLRTEMMRNAYLTAAFLVFPYSLYHFIPTDYVPLSWVGVALAYYGFSALIRNAKYRWMGHFTLILTALYVLIIGIVQLDTTFRVISFLVLGVVLLGTSVYFTRRRNRKRASAS